MYSIIIAIHAVFFLLAHILEYRILEGIFLILWIFFLFYFSPLFFIEKENTKENNSPLFDLKKFSENFSVKNSLFIPLTMFYIALYGFVLWAFWTSESLILIHSLLSIGIFLLFIGYVLSFEWKNDIFFDMYTYHVGILFLSSVSFYILHFFFPSFVSIFSLSLTFISSIAGIFYFSFTRENQPIFSIFFLGSVFVFFYFLSIFFFPTSSWELSLILLVWGGIIGFEFLPQFSYFRNQETVFRYSSVIWTLIALPFLFYLSFSEIFFSFSLLMILMVFYFSLHSRYSNYILYSLGLLIIYFLYSIFFSSLLHSWSLVSVLLFIFFLPFLLVSVTYFWEERYEYDFYILHSSAIGFSSIFSIYAFFFLPWENILFFLSSCILGLAIIITLSHFRFRK